MALTQQQQKNAEKLIDQHFGILKDALNQEGRIAQAEEVVITPELVALTEARAEERKAEQEAQTASLIKYIEDVKALGFPIKDRHVNPYDRATLPEHLRQDIVNQVRNMAYETRRVEISEAWEKVSEAHSEARRKVLIATLTDAAEANALIQSLPGLDTFLAQPEATPEA